MVAGSLRVLELGILEFPDFVYSLAHSKRTRAYQSLIAGVRFNTLSLTLSIRES